MSCKEQEKSISIKDKADILLEKIYGDIDSIELPVNLSTALSREGLKLLYFSPEELDFLGDAIIPSNVHGVYIRDSKTVLVQKGLPYNRTAFTIAHEIGHHLLHEKLHFRLDQSDYLIQNSIEEKEANSFASCLLMPENVMKKYWETSFHNPVIMARAFHVSQMAMDIRIKELKESKVLK